MIHLSEASQLCIDAIKDIEKFDYEPFSDPFKASENKRHVVIESKVTVTHCKRKEKVPFKVLWPKNSVRPGFDLNVKFGSDRKTQYLKDRHNLWEVIYLFMFHTVDCRMEQRVYEEAQEYYRNLKSKKRRKSKKQLDKTKMPVE